MEGTSLGVFESPLSSSKTCSLSLHAFDECNCGLNKMTKQLLTPASTLTSQNIETENKAKKGSKKTQAKPLLFINHDAKHLKSQATRSEVTSHLRGTYLPWKQRMEARARREIKNQAMRQISSKRSTEITDPNRSLVRSVAFRRSTPSSEGASDGDDNSLIRFDGRYNGKEFNTVIPPQGLSPLVYQGNSDPFSSLSLKVTPLIAELIEFEHAHLHPCVYSNKDSSNRTYSKSYLADIQSPEKSQAAVYGYLSRAAFVLARATKNPKYDRLALVLKGKSSSLLRAQLASGEVIDQGDVIRKILALMISEVFSHNYDAALIHSKVLLKMLEQESKSEGLDMRFFFSVIYSEVQRACMSLTRPCFDAGPNGWVAKTFDRAGRGAYDAFVSTLGLERLQPDNSVLGLDLAALFDEVRSVRIVSQLYSTSRLYGIPTPLALYLPSRVVLCIGKLVSYYLDHLQLYGQSTSPRVLIHRIAALAALHWVRIAGNIDSIRVSSSCSIYSAGPMYLAKIRDILSDFEAFASDRELQLYQDLRFWALYIGAIDEQGRGNADEDKDDWFTRQLTQAATFGDIYTWQQARPILELFTYTDTVEPHGSTWFSSIFAGGSSGSACVAGTFGSHAMRPSSEEADYFAHITDQTVSALSKNRIAHVPVIFESRLPVCNLRYDKLITSVKSEICSHTGEQSLSSVTPTPRPANLAYRSRDMPPESRLCPLHNQSRADAVPLGLGDSKRRPATDSIVKNEAPTETTPPSGTFTCNSWDMINEQHEGTKCEQRYRVKKEDYVAMMTDPKITGISRRLVHYAMYTEEEMDDLVARG